MRGQASTSFPQCNHPFERQNKEPQHWWESNFLAFFAIYSEFLAIFSNILIQLWQIGCYLLVVWYKRFSTNILRQTSINFSSHLSSALSNCYYELKQRSKHEAIQDRKSFLEERWRACSKRQRDTKPLLIKIFKDNPICFFKSSTFQLLQKAWDRTCQPKPFEKHDFSLPAR